MKGRYDAAPSGEAREEIALAVRFGLAALDHRDLGWPAFLERYGASWRLCRLEAPYAPWVKAGKRTLTRSACPAVFQAGAAAQTSFFDRYSEKILAILKSLWYPIQAYKGRSSAARGKPREKAGKNAYYNRRKYPWISSRNWTKRRWARRRPRCRSATPCVSTWRSRKAPGSASRSSRAPSSPRSTAASRRPSPSAASPTAWAWRRCSPSTLPPSRPFRSSAMAPSAGPSCTTCGAAWARPPRSRRSCKIPKNKREAQASLFLFPSEGVLCTCIPAGHRGS